jgi:hypothetical protein
MEQALRTARRIAAAAAHARWAITGQEAGPGRQAALDELGRRVYPALIQTAEPGKRSDALQAPRISRPGDALAGLLERASDLALGLPADGGPDGD